MPHIDTIAETDLGMRQALAFNPNLNRFSGIDDISAGPIFSVVQQSNVLNGWLWGDIKIGEVPGITALLDVQVPFSTVVQRIGIQDAQHFTVCYDGFGDDLCN